MNYKINEVNVQVTKEEADIFDRVMQRLRDSVHADNDVARFATRNFEACICWYDGDHGQEGRPRWDFTISYKLTSEHCQGRGYWWTHPLRPQNTWSRGYMEDDPDWVKCPGCVACTINGQKQD